MLTIFFQFKALLWVICFGLLDNKNIFFSPNLYTHLTFFSHISNNLTYKILIYNISHRLVLLLWRQRLGVLTEVLYNNCFQIFLDLKLTEHPSITLFTSNYQAGIKIFLLDPSLEICLVNGIRIYGNALSVQKILQLINEFFFIWESFGFIQISTKNLMIVLPQND